MRHRSAVATLIACALAGCTTLRPVPGPPAAVVGHLGRENVVVLTTARGDRVRLADVHVQGDSLVGLRSAASRERVALALDEVRSVDVAEVNGRHTAVVIAAVGVAILALVIAAQRALSGL